MKTPEEIKKGQEQCVASKGCNGCPYEDDCYEIFSNVPMIKETFAYIQQLEADNASKDERIQMLEAGMEQWHDVAASPGAVEDMARENYRLAQELEAVKRERDAAVADLRVDCRCWFCKHFKGQPNKQPCVSCSAVDSRHNIKSHWEWRGVCPENAEVQDDE